MRVFDGEVHDKVMDGETIGRTIPSTVSAYYAGNRRSAGTKAFGNVCRGGA